MVVIGRERQHHAISGAMSFVQDEAEGDAWGGEVLTGVLRGLVPRVRCDNARDCDDRWPRDGVNDTLNGVTTMEAPAGVAGAPHLVARNCLRPEPSPKDNKASFRHILPVSALFASTLSDWFAYLIRRSTPGLTAEWTVRQRHCLMR